MRRPAAKVWALSCLILLGMAGAAHGAGWQQIFSNLSVADQIVEGQAESRQVYRGLINWTISDGDGLAGNFMANDQIDIEIAGTTLQFDGDNAGLTEYANAHAREIWEALFGTSPAAAVAGTSEGQFSSGQVISNLVPPAVPTLLARKWTSDITASGEYNYLEVDGVDVTGNAGIMSYGHTIFGPANQVGFAMPYRLLEAEDSLGTNLDAFQPTFFFKRNIYTGQPVFLTWGVAGFFGVNHVNSELLEDGYYFRYGGNTFASVGREIFPWLALFGDLSYEIGKFWMPEGWVDEEIRFLPKALNDLPLDHTLTAGVRAGFVAIPDWLWGTVQVFRIHALGEDVPSANDTQTVVMGKLGTQVLNFLYIDVGYKTSFEIEDYDDNTFILNIRAAF